MQGGPPDTWPLRAVSRHQRGPVHDWHLAEAGEGPRILLLHGAGGSVHSVAGIFDRLKTDHHVLAIDLPGHGFTRLGAQRRSGLKPMAEDVLSLCADIGFRPDVIVGHSAGAAIALQIARDHKDIPIIGINPALGHFEGLAGFIFPAMAKLLAMTPFSAKLFSGASAKPTRIKSLIDSTGSVLSEDALAHYQFLVAQEPHVAGTLAMMAQWSLDELLAALPQISNRVLFLIGENDQTVPPKVGHAAADQMPDAQVFAIPELGHLLHEEDPDLAVRDIREFLAKKA